MIMVDVVWKYCSHDPVRGDARFAEHVEGGVGWPP